MSRLNRNSVTPQWDYILAVFETGKHTMAFLFH